MKTSVSTILNRATATAAPRRATCLVRTLCIGILLGACLTAARATSLYDGARFQSLTQDRRALRMGDSLTVLVLENSSASSNANTELDKQGGAGLGLSAHDPKLGGRFDIDLNEEHKGGGKITRSGRLAAQITVTVMGVEPNGDLFVSGRQVIHVNDEKQEIVLKGRVRPRDIAENNTVLSSRLADASISYLGEGILAEKQKPGILTRLLSWLGLL